MWLVSMALAGPAWLGDASLPLPASARLEADGRVRVIARGDRETLVGRGLTPLASRGGRPLGRSGFVPLAVTRAELAALIADGVPVVPDRAVDLGPPPTNVTSALTGATAVRNALPDGPTGAGVLVANVDTDLEVTHPHFFRADAGIHPWTDVDGDGVLTPGVDGIDLDGNGAIDTTEVLWRLESFTFRYDVSIPDYVEDHHAGLDPRVDWLYLDLDGDRARGAGRPDWTDDDPGMAEPTFVPDDVDGDGRIERSERLWQLGSSVVEAVWWDGRVFERGEGLSRYDRQLPEDADRSHGTGVSGVMVGGQLPRQRDRVGLAPDADLLFVSRVTVTSTVDLVDMLEWVGSRDADVMLHEYAPWTGYALDGTSVLEQLVDELAEDGMVQVCPAGNLADAGKHARVPTPGGELTLGVEVLWSTDYIELEIHAEPAIVPETCVFRRTDATASFSLAPGYREVGPTGVWAEPDVSPAGNARLHAFLYGGELEAGSWVLECSAPGMTAADVYSSDLGGWGRLVVLDDAIPANTMGVPATSEHCVSVGAYGGRWDDGSGLPGELRSWSSRGPALRTDKTIDLAAPDDPFVPIASYGELEWSGAYAAFSGTSGAAPHVAAVAALVKQAHPDWTGVQVREHLVASAEPVDAGSPHGWGAGRVDAWAALGDGPRPEAPDPVVVERPLGVDLGPSILDAGDEVRWDVGYDGTVDHVGPTLALAPGEVARVEVLRGGWRVGGTVRRGSSGGGEARRGCGCAAGVPVPAWVGGLGLGLALARRRREGPCFD